MERAQDGRPPRRRGCPDTSSFLLLVIERARFLILTDSTWRRGTDGLTKRIKNLEHTTSVCHIDRALFVQEVGPWAVAPNPYNRSHARHIRDESTTLLPPELSDSPNPDLPPRPRCLARNTQFRWKVTDLLVRQ